VRAHHRKGPGGGHDVACVALAVQARTLEFYRQVDLADPVVNAGVKVAGVNR
jgi:hypothetical protein